MPEYYVIMHYNMHLPNLSSHAASRWPAQANKVMRKKGQQTVFCRFFCFLLLFSNVCLSASISSWVVLHNGCLWCYGRHGAVVCCPNPVTEHPRRLCIPARSLHIPHMWHMCTAGQRRVSTAGLLRLLRVVRSCGSLLLAPWLWWSPVCTESFLGVGLTFSCVG